MTDCIENAVVIQDTNPVVQISSPSDGFVVVTPTSHVVVVECNNEVVVIQEDSVLVRITEEAQVPITEEQVAVLVSEDVTQVVSVGEQGPAGADGSGTVQVNSSVNFAGTVTADSITLTVEQGVDWVVTATDSATGAAVYARVNVAAVHRVSTVTHIVYGRMGDRIFTVDVDILSGEMRLRVMNEHTEALDINVLRFATLIA